MAVIPVTMLMLAPAPLGDLRWAWKGCIIVASLVAAIVAIAFVMESL